ncbi:MAG: hypothetical protein DRP50_04275 [Thermotoga sp.]|nr:hypothetical protein [Thermotogota bacterium]RKX54502.1 MAG: hypothetical protein DRP50_04275 [Thermotoga sp.]
MVIDYSTLGIIPVETGDIQEYGSDIYLDILISNIKCILKKYDITMPAMDKNKYTGYFRFGDKLDLLLRDLNSHLAQLKVEFILIRKPNGVFIEIRKRIDDILKHEEEKMDRIVQLLGKIMPKEQ